MDQVQSNRLHVEYLNRIMVEQNRFGFESDGWTRQLGYRGPVRGLVLVGESREDRELVVGRLQHHGVRLSATVQRERHVLVVQHEHLPEMLRHTPQTGVTAGLGAEATLDRTHQSLEEAVWAVLAQTPRPGISVVEFSTSHESPTRRRSRSCAWPFGSTTARVTPSGSRAPWRGPRGTVRRAAPRGRSAQPCVRSMTGDQRLRPAP